MANKRPLTNNSGTISEVSNSDYLALPVHTINDGDTSPDPNASNVIVFSDAENAFMWWDDLNTVWRKMIVTGSTVTVDDGGGSLTVDGTVEITNDVGNPIPVSDGGGTLTVDGTVTINDGGGSISVDDGGGSLTVDGSVTADTELTTKDYDTGAGTETVAVTGLIVPASGGSVNITGDAANGLDVDVTHVVPGTAAADLGKAEDAVAASGDTGVMALTVRSDSAVTTVSNAGDYQALITDASGRLWTNVGAWAGNTISTNSGVKDAGTLRVTLATDQAQFNTALNVSIGVGAATIAKAEDAVAAQGDVGVMVLSVRDDTPTSSVSANGDYITLKSYVDGRLWVLPSPLMATVTATPTVSTSPAYTAGDQVGGVMTFTSAAIATGRGGQIVNAYLIDKGKQKATLELWLFLASPTLVNSDNGAFDITDSNLVTATPIGVIDFSSGDYRDSGSNSFCQGEQSGGPVNIPFVTTSTANLFGVFVTRGTPTYASTTDLVVGLTVTQF